MYSLVYCCPWLGVKLLLKMGWRRGHSIKDSHANSLYGMFCQYYFKDAKSLHFIFAQM